MMSVVEKNGAANGRVWGGDGEVVPEGDVMRFDGEGPVQAVAGLGR
jgi:hypothetical protein